MYDVSGTDTDREWIEVFNAGTSSVHVTEWKFFEANTNHAITSVQGGENLAAGAYAVIADNPTKFLQDWPSYSGMLFDSTFSLGNSGETLAIHMPPPDFAETDSISYQSAWGAAGNGNSLQRVSISSQNFTEAMPTPGTGSLGASSNVPSDINTNTVAVPTTGSSSPGESTAAPPPKIYADGGSDRTVIVGADTEFKARAYDEKKNNIDYSYFLWNFGDGSTAETATVFHRFDYPGRYVVVLDIPAEKNSVLDQILVTVEPMRLVLSLLPDGGVAIENQSGRTLDISRWILHSMGRTFTIPDHTFVLANNPLRISQKTLGFSSGGDITLAYPGGEFALGVVPAATPTSTSAISASVPTPRIQHTADDEAESQVSVFPQEPASDEESERIATTTQAGFSQVAGAAGAMQGTSPVWWFGALGIGGIAAGALVLARRFGKNEWDIEEMSETR